jgi:virulence-associated protein VagC
MYIRGFIKRAGNAVVLFPTAKSWDVLLQSLDKVPEDFMTNREQPSG